MGSIRPVVRIKSVLANVISCSLSKKVLFVFHLAVNPKMSLNLKPWNVKTGSESFQDG